MSYNVKVNGNILPQTYSDTDIRGYAPAWREYKADVQVALSGTHMYVSLAKFLGEPESPRPQPANAPPIQAGHAPSPSTYAPPVQAGYAQPVYSPSPAGYAQPGRSQYTPPPEASGYRATPTAVDGSIMRVVGFFIVMVVIGSAAIFGGLHLGPRFFGFAIISLVLGLYRAFRS